MLPSSHSSPIDLLSTPSPHLGRAMQVFGRGHEKPSSTTQPAVQPLPGFGLSHVSPASICPLPHTALGPTSGEKLLQPGKQPSVPGGSQISPGSTALLPQTI